MRLDLPLLLQNHRTVATVGAMFTEFLMNKRGCDVRLNGHNEGGEQLRRVLFVEGCADKLDEFRRGQRFLPDHCVGSGVLVVNVGHATDHDHGNVGLQLTKLAHEFSAAGSGQNMVCNDDTKMAAS